ncbi:MAG: hypothetical protein NC203_01175 [Firmicutes bacterium]|nr:hypothetical protein [[Eubacterium] siraeum]MCM1486952.1 hypothetical protein [Bacillota bacterium]
MSEVIKGNSPINNIIIEGTVEISNKIAGLDDVKPKKNLSEEAEDAENSESLEDSQEQTDEPEEERYTVNYEELEALRDQYRREGEEQVKYLVQRSEQELANARSEADEIVKKARNEAASVLAQADKEAEQNKQQATEEGYSKGFEEGMSKGMEDGYTDGVKKCKETMEDLRRLYAEYGREKDGLMAENRRAIFDLSMSIAEKITMSVFTQKSKNALEKMISSAAKEFRKAKNIRVTMSKLDISEDFIADSEVLQKCFPQTANVEYELLENAERGTLLVEGDSEILDAGVSTQLKMIEELGRGKFREKEPEQVTEVLTDTAENVAAEQEKPKKRKHTAADSAPAAEAPTEPAADIADTADEAVEAAVNTAVGVEEILPEAAADIAAEAAAENIDVSADDIIAEAEAALKSAQAADPKTADENTAEISSELSADDLAAAVDSLLAEADIDGLGLDLDDLEQDNLQALDNTISLTKNPVAADDE